ncbi:hypothetical protein [Massilia scottii]|nr:hypothetical protein [Massilia sp. CCM 9029]MDQ1831963.1 hypothetical protein [Massilia sp. CCM 9029]
MLTFTILLGGIALGLFTIITLGGIVLSIVAVIAATNESVARRHYEHEL